ncbi:GroES (chaperonin 10)-like protein [Naviculisporaceae sp. PSN 640]
MASTNGTPNKTMRAVVWEGKPFEMAVRDVPLPEIQQPEDAIVRMTTAAICGSDLHTYHGLFGSSTPPWQMGHEGVGVVIAVGSATERFRVGDRVLIPGGTDAGFFSVDQTFQEQGVFYGQGPDFGNLGGTQAEYLRVPFADDSLVAIPDNFSSDLDWLFLSDIFPTAWTGLNFARFQAGDTVAVFGAGPVGLMCAYIALLRGASRVYSIDHVRDRLDKAASIGAIPIDFTSPAGTASEQILRREPTGGVERTVDCIGQTCVNHHLKPQQNYVIEEAIKVTKFNGGIGLVGVYASLPSSAGAPLGDTMDKQLSISLPDLWLKNLSVGTGTVGPSLYNVLPRAWDLVKSGRVKLDWVVSSQIGIEDAPKAYQRFNKKQEIKMVITFPWVNKERLAAEPNVTENGGSGSEAEKKEQFRLPIRKKNRRPLPM